MPQTDLLPWLRLARLKGIGPILTKRLLETFHTPEAILNAHPSALAAIEGIGTYRANQIVTSAPETESSARAELALTLQHNITLLPQSDPRYPPALKTILDPPILLYMRGTLEPADALAVGIVGARECTLYGREQATRFGHDLAAANLTIISGGARGIDTCAHQGALRAKGRTLVIMGCGLLHTYPPENKDLFKRIVDENAGAIISELPLDAPPAKENFPPRNRIIAGMSLGILVIEANLRSGSLITARLAADDYGREVFALPGRVDSPASAGTHHLLKSAAAHLVESAEDILAHLGDVGIALKKIEPTIPPAEMTASLFAEQSKMENQKLQIPFTSVQQKILAALSPKAPSSIDDLLEKTSLLPAVLMAELTTLQLRSALTRHPANRFTRTS